MASDSDNGVTTSCAHWKYFLGYLLLALFVVTIHLYLWMQIWLNVQGLPWQGAIEVLVILVDCSGLT